MMASAKSERWHPHALLLLLLLSKCKHLQAIYEKLFKHEFVRARVENFVGKGGITSNHHFTFSYNVSNEILTQGHEKLRSSGFTMIS